MAEKKIDQSKIPVPTPPLTTDNLLSTGLQTLYNFFMQTPALLCILKGREHVFELANPLYHQFTGNRILIGKKLIEALPELKGQGFLEILDNVYMTGELFIGQEVPIAIESKKGFFTQHFLNFNYQALRDAQDNIEGILVFAYDVTEQVIARRQLELNAAMIQNLYMNAPAYVCTFSGPQHTYTLVNPSYQKLFGKREIAGKPILEALPELVGQGFDKILDNVYRTGEIYVGIEVLIILARDEGLLPEERYFNFSYQPIYELDKSIDGILVFGYEVTDEVNARKIQKEIESRFLMMTDAMPQKMWIADKDGRANYFNKLWFGYTHKKFAELEGRGWESLIHPDDSDRNRQEWEQAIETGEAFEQECRLLRFDGTYRWHLSRNISQNDEKGNVITWLGTYTDINEQKLVAEELYKQIEERIKLERLKNEFISMAAHELKTPVTSIKGYAQVLQHRFKNEGNILAETFLLKMDKQIDKLTSLINDLLDSTKMTSGQLKFNEELFDFNELVNEIADEMQQTSKRVNIDVILDTNEFIFGDRNRIGQVITNMLSNAIKYSPKADLIIVTTIHEDNNIKFCVQDFGIGIPKENQPHVFDQFFRVSGFVQDTFAGLGLGLYIASEIIRRHHGLMTVESEEGKGSTFCFTLPIGKI